MIEWGTILLAVVGSLSVSEIIHLFTIRETKKGMRLDNQQKESDNYVKLIDELQDQNNNLNEKLEKKDERILELEDKNDTLRQSLDSVRTKCAVAELLKCVNVSCQDREPKLGTRKVDVEEIMVDTYGK